MNRLSPFIAAAVSALSSAKSGVFDIKALMVPDVAMPNMAGSKSATRGFNRLSQKGKRRRLRQQRSQSFRR